MNEEMRVEAMELCVTACEKFANNNEVGKSTDHHACMWCSKSHSSAQLLQISVILRGKSMYCRH